MNQTAEAAVAAVKAFSVSPARIEDHLIAGTLAGLTSTGLLFPLDLIKTHYQVYDHAGRPYTSVMQGMRHVVKTEGYRGLYKGLSPALLANGVSWGGYFLFYEHAKNRYLKRAASEASGSNTAPKRLTAVHHLLSAFEAGIIMVFLTNPLWLIKTRMQLQPTVTVTAAAAAGGGGAGQEAYRGLLHAVRTIVREEGAMGLYKGLLPAILLTSHGALQFVTYEWLKRVAEPYHVPLLSYSVLGGIAKIVAGLATYPYQVIKARLQQRETGASRWRYAGTWDCVVKIWRYEGLLGFFKGCVPNVLKTAPSAAVTFVVYEECIKAINSYRGMPPTVVTATSAAAAAAAGGGGAKESGGGGRGGAKDAAASAAAGGGGRGRGG